jgi:hypothetical protein
VVGEAARDLKNTRLEALVANLVSQSSSKVSTYPVRFWRYPCQWSSRSGCVGCSNCPVSFTRKSKSFIAAHVLGDLVPDCAIGGVTPQRVLDFALQSSTVCYCEPTMAVSKVEVSVVHCASTFMDRVPARVKTSKMSMVQIFTIPKQGLRKMG